MMQIITDGSKKELKKHGSDSFPFLVSYEKLSRYESGSFLWHWHPEIEITYVQKGQIAYQVNRRRYHLKEGELLFGNANVLHAGYMENTCDCEYISVTFSPKLIYGFSQSAVCTRYVEPVTQNFALSAIHFDFSKPWHRSFADAFLEMVALFEKKPPLYELEITIRMQCLWKILLENLPSAADAPSYNEAEFQRIREMISYIEHNYMHKFSLKDIADHIHLCESECSRLFKRNMNVSLFSFLQEYRIEQSLEYLNSGDSVSDIAQKVGFSDSNYYSKVFTKLKGCSPQKYRRKLL